MVQTRETRRTEFVQSHEGNGIQSNATPTQSSTKKSTTVKRRRRREPGELCRLNLDVLFLLAAYLHPIDLLNLARTCKSLRGLLMDRASEFVWKSARRQVEGLPNCPDDLTEPEYANLVFCARCHGCGKYVKTVLWNIRRRYCPNCRRSRLRAIENCSRVIKENKIMPNKLLEISGRTTKWADREQIKWFMDEYNRSSDKNTLLRERKEQCLAINLHAEKCEVWDAKLARDRRKAIRERREVREYCVFERLWQLGFGPDINFFGSHAIRGSYEPFFKTSKPLHEKEWTKALPKWLEIMNGYKFRRLDATVYPKRRKLLVSQYDNYLTHPTPDSHKFYILPHVHDLACFPPFQDIIKAPEDTEMGDKLFEIAFAQLPAFIDEWRLKLEAELAELVQIPSHLSSKGASKGKGRHTIRTQPFQAPSRKLNLACAVFATTRVTSTYPDVLHTVSPRLLPRVDETFSIETLGVRFLKNAPYIVFACGLDPHVATIEEMDRRNARLECLICNDQLVRNWRDALRHAWNSHDRNEDQWQVVDDSHIDAIQAAEQSIECPLRCSRCLLCRPHIGDLNHGVPFSHLESCHGVKKADVKIGVHYAPLRREPRSVKMIKKGDKITFKDPIQESSTDIW